MVRKRSQVGICWGLFVNGLHRRDLQDEIQALISSRFILSQSVLRLMPNNSAVRLTLPSQRCRARRMCMRSACATINCKGAISSLSWHEPRLCRGCLPAVRPECLINPESGTPQEVLVTGGKTNRGSPICAPSPKPFLSSATRKPPGAVPPAPPRSRSSS